jgi:hypothetical protein
MEFYLAIKNNEIFSLVGELDNIIFSEVGLAQKAKGFMFSLICGK